MVRQREEFMKKFKARRIKHDENVQKKVKNTKKKEFNETMNMLKTFTHSDLTKNSVAKNLRKMKNHPSYPYLRNCNFKSTKEKLKQIDGDFEHCISNLILSEDNLQRNKKKRIVRLRDFKKMPKKSIINSIKYSLRKLKGMNRRNLLSSVGMDGAMNSHELSKIEIGATFPEIQDIYYPLTERKNLGKLAKKKKTVYLTATNRIMLTKNNTNNQSHDGNLLFSDLSDLKRMPIFRVTRSKSKRKRISSKPRLRKTSVGPHLSPIKGGRRSRRTETTRFG